MSSDWQNSCKHISDSFIYMYKKELYTDCTFLVGETDIKVFKAHKHVLVGVSPVFECMFYGKVSEQVNEVPVPDIDPTTFEKFLSAIYTDNLYLNKFDEACNMFYAANKYMVERIKDPCLAYILESINHSNVAEAYEFFMLFGQKEAAEDCMKVILSETSEVIASDQFLNIQKETLFKILKSDSLAINNERELYDAAVRWIEAEIVRKGLEDESEKKALYREILAYIRFLSMSGKEFARGPARERYLSKDEILGVLLNIVDPDESVALPTDFSTEKRKFHVAGRNYKLMHKGKTMFIHMMLDAAKAGNVNVMAELAECGADLKMRAKNRWSLLHWTAQKGHLEATNWLLKKGLDPNSTNIYGSNVVHSAVYSGRLEVVQQVVTYGGDPNCRDVEGMTPLDLAVTLRHQQIAEYLRGLM